MIINFNGQGGGGEDPRVDQLINKVNAISGDVETLNEKVEDLQDTSVDASLDNINEDGEAKINEVMKLKTINGEELKGEGDIEIKGGGEKVVVTYQYIYGTKTKTYDVGEVIDFKSFLTASAYTYVKIENYVTTTKLTFRERTDKAITIDVLEIKGGDYTNLPSSFEYNTTIKTLIIDGVVSGGGPSTQWEKANVEVIYYKQNLKEGSALLGKTRTIIDTPIATISKQNTSVKSVGLEGSDVDVILTNNVTKLYSAFYFCRSLTSVTLPNTITVIGTNAFYYCDSLTSITIPDSVTTIDKQAFCYCSSLKEITIPSSVKNIDNAFDSVPTGGTLYCDDDWFNSLTSTQKNNLGRVANWERKPIPTPLPLDERVDDLDERVTALEEGGGGGGSFLPLSGGTLNGNVFLGKGDVTTATQLTSIRNVNDMANGGAFYVNSDGTAAFFHKTYGTTSLTQAVNDAILKFNHQGLYFAQGATNRTTASDFKKVLLENMFSYDPITKTLDINFI